MMQAINSFLGWPGRFFIRRLDYIINLTTFVCLVLRDWFRQFSFFDRQSYRPLVSQIIFTGIDAMPTIIFLALVTGFIFTFQLIALFNSVADTVSILIYVIGLELGPLITAITLISRTGSAIAVDLGNMKLHNEIQSLELMGVDIYQYLIAPRIIAVTISQLVVAVFFTVGALACGILISGLLISHTHFNYLLKLPEGVEPLLLLIFVVKNLLFGMTIGAVSCYHGLRVEKSATEVPQQTQQAIVTILILLFIIDGVIAVVLI